MWPLLHKIREGGRSREPWKPTSTVIRRRERPRCHQSRPQAVGVGQATSRGGRIVLSEVGAGRYMQTSLQKGGAGRGEDLAMQTHLT